MLSFLSLGPRQRLGFNLAAADSTTETTLRLSAPILGVSPGPGVLYPVPAPFWSANSRVVLTPFVGCSCLAGSGGSAFFCRLIWFQAWRFGRNSILLVKSLYQLAGIGLVGVGCGIWAPDGVMGVTGGFVFRCAAQLVNSSWLSFDLIISEKYTQ